MRIAARAPNHLGDAVMALPALNAVSRVGELVIYAPPFGPDLFRGVRAEVRPRGVMSGDVALLFAPSLRAALEAVACPRRIGVDWDHRRWLLTDIVAAGPHTSDTYRRIVSVLGAAVEGEPRFPADEVEDHAVPAGHIGLNPLSATGAVREWRGFAGLADALAERGHDVVFYAGPGEADRLAPLVGRYRCAVGTSLPRFARLLSRCRVFVSVDTGAAHFARACGTPVVVVYGSTTAAASGPAGSWGVEGPELPCRPCFSRVCRPGMGAEHGCLGLPVEAVLAAIDTRLGGGDA